MRAPIEKDGTWWLQNDGGEWHVWDAKTGAWVAANLSGESPSTRGADIPEQDAGQSSPLSNAPKGTEPAQDVSTVKDRRSSPLWALIAALLGVPIAFAIGMAVGSAESEQLRERSAALTTENNDLSDQLAETEEGLDETQAENTSLQEDLGEAETALEAAKAKRPIPNFVGDDEDSVINFADDLGWDVTVQEQPTEEKSPGTVISQNPDPGTVMRAGSTFTITVVKEPPPGWKDIAVFTGQGENNTRTFSLPDGKVRVLYSFSGNTNAALTLYQQPRRYKDLLLNEIGDRSGETRIYYSGSGYYFEVCCGSWTIRLQEFR